MTPTDQVLFLSLSGIGNFLMQLPAIKAYRQLFPSAKITLWTAPRGTKPLALVQPEIDAVFSAPISRSLLLQAGVINNLHRGRFQRAIMLSPGQRWKGALHLLLAGIPERIGHSYPHLGNPASSFLLTKTTPEEPALHDLEQNLKLISLLGHLPKPPALYALHLPPAYQATAAQTFARLNIPPGKKIIGLHAGSAANFLWKRWPVLRFIKMAQELIKHDSAYLLLFGGPDEIKLTRQLLRGLGKPNASLVKADLLTVAALMRHCQLFISNDSGLMHLSAAVGTPTLGLFGPTDEKRTGPRGPRSYVFRAPGTAPEYHTEANYDLGSQPHPSLLAIQETDILNFIRTHQLLA